VFDRCPHAWLRDEARAEADLVDDVLFYERDGILPHAGGRLDQSPAFVEALTIVREERAGIEAIDAASKKAGT
jgi:hypothetical protein